MRDFCLLYQPVFTAAGDTAETRGQADANNAVFMELCGITPRGGRDAP